MKRLKFPIHGYQFFLGSPERTTGIVCNTQDTQRDPTDSSETLGIRFHRASCLQTKGFCWFDLGENIGHGDFYTSRSFISVFYTSTHTTQVPRFIRSQCSTTFLTSSLVLFPPCSVQAAHVGCLFLVIQRLFWSSKF